MKHESAGNCLSGRPAQAPFLRRGSNEWLAPQFDTISYIGNISDISMLDNFVPYELQTELNRLFAGPIWAFGWKSNRKRDVNSYWHAHFAGGNSATRESCAHELSSDWKLRSVRKFWDLMNGGPLAGHVPLRVYANAHSFGVEGHIHSDSSDSDTYTTIYYAHPEWRADWGGETIFYNSGATEIIGAVYPRPNRIVTFNGSLPHCAKAPSRECPALRVSLVLKTKRTG